MSTVIDEVKPQLRHSHGPNFGRYVADCPMCAAKYPDGPPHPKPRKRERSRQHPAQLTREQMIAELERQGLSVTPAEAPPAVAAVAASAGMTEDQLLRIMVEANRALGAELRRPDPEVEAEKQAQRIRTQIAKANERMIVEEARAKTEALQANCASMGHKQNGGLSQNSAISGQGCTGARKVHWTWVS